MIIPARNAEQTIGTTLAALGRQDSAGPFEILVVDDGSSDRTGAVARAAGATVLEQKRPGGPAAARNAGAAASDAALLAFTDADCEPAPGWLRAGRAALEGGAHLVTGPIRPIREAGPYDRTLRVEKPSPLFESANLFVTREAFAAVGGFVRPSFLPRSVPHFGEDVVFGWNVVRTGAVRRFAPDATMFHAVFSRGRREYIAERRRLRLFPPLVKEVPELRHSMPLRIFLSRHTARSFFAFAGTAFAVARRSPLPLLAALPYARAELASGKPWKRSVAGYNSVQVCSDLIGLGALAWGSVRNRTLVL